MKLTRKSNGILFVLFSALIFSCEKDFNTIGTDVISNNHFEMAKTYADVFTYNRKINTVQTNGLPLYQLGRYTDPLYGETQAQIATQLTLQSVNPTFGAYSQELEDNADTDESILTIPENETVTAVYLNIPFFSEVTDTDEDGNRTFRIDSVLGNLNTNFNLKVEELTFYLGDLDPENNFETAQEYFSDHDFSSSTGMVLFDDMYTIDTNEILIYGEDDPDTEENEAEIVSERLDPRIRIALDPAFFQQHILDAEGTEFLANSNNFKEYLRGLYISAGSFSDDLLMLFDLSHANIEIQYSYDKVDTKGTTDDTSDDEIVAETSVFLLNLSGNIVNSFTNAPYPAAISDELNTNLNASRLYLKGGAGTFVEIKLFDEDDANANLNAIRANNWLINEANLTFYVDRATLDGAPGDVTEPERIYLYDMEHNVPLLDHSFDRTTNPLNPKTSRTVYGGILEKNEEEKGIRYKIRLTEHIKNIIRKDSTNVRLGLVLTSNINNTGLSTAVLEPAQEIRTATASVVTPLG
ncbi:MAG: DUF4270 domain-containing protein, partial [Sinomicrobium sp.]|nr:DUF4270 domain-containing protein [Sinomicrobium sp.]